MIWRLDPVAKLYLLVAVLLAIIMGMGICCIIQMSAMRQNNLTLYKDRELPVQQLGNIRFCYGNILYATQQANSSQISLYDAYRHVQQAHNSIRADWNAYLHTYLTPTEKNLAGKTNASIIRSDTGIERLKIVLKKADHAALNRMANGDLYASFSPAIFKMDQLLQLQLKISRDINESSHSRFRSVLIRLMAIIALSLIFALPFSYYLVKNIRNMIRDLHVSNQYIKESEEKYRYLFDHSPAYIIVWDPETLAVLEVNDRAAEGYGYSKPEFNRLSILDLWNPNEHEKIKELASGILAGGIFVSAGRYHHKKKNGEEILIDAASHQIIYKNHKAVLSIGNDVTDRVKAEYSLQKSEELFHALIDHAADGIFMVTDNGVIFDVNHSAANLFGYGKEELIGMNISALYPREACAELPVLWERLRRDKSVTDERALLRKDGSQVQVLVSRGILPDGSRAIGIVRDITEQKDAENQLRRQNDQLREIAFMQSHILRRPVASILGLVNLFNADNLADPLNQQLIQMIGVASGELDEGIKQVVMKTEETGREKG